jgi:hypothetical protein
MSTIDTNATIPPTVTTPAHPAKGNQRGQTTLAAEIDRWQAMVNNLTPQIDDLPGLKDPLTQFQTLLTEAKALRDQLNTLKASTGTAMIRRNQMLSNGGDLFSRLTLSLQGLHGPRNPALRQFGLKPRKVSPIRLNSPHPRR